MVFVFPREDEITSEVVEKFISEHKKLVPSYLYNKDMYEGRHEILTREARDTYKPDNRIVVNFARMMVDTFNGFFNGIPVKVSHDKEQVEAFLGVFSGVNGIEDSEAELAKLTSIYGHAYEYIYQDEDANSRLLASTPIDTFLVYDDSVIGSRLFAVRYQYDYEGFLVGELVDSVNRYKIRENADGSITIEEGIPHYYGGVPVIEYVENEERQSLFENAKTLINALNKAISAKMDDVDYFADSYLKVIGADLDEKTMTDLRANRTINLTGDGANDVTIEFLAKPDADQTQENLIDRLIDLIFQVSMVVNMNDSKFGNDPSGVSLRYKSQQMNNLAISKERKFQRSMQRRYKLLFQLPTNVPSNLRDEWANLEYAFTRNEPKNLAEEAEVATKLEGVVSKETQLRLLSIVKDAKVEMERIESENEPLPEYDSEKM